MRKRRSSHSRKQKRTHAPQRAKKPAPRRRRSTSTSALAPAEHVERFIPPASTPDTSNGNGDAPPGETSAPPSVTPQHAIGQPLPLSTVSPGLRAAQKDDVLLADIQSASTDPAQCHVWWLGQSGYLIKWKEYLLLIDPYLSDSLTEKYEDTDKPHVRMAERVLDPIRLDHVTLAFSSHNHTDHLDAATLVPVAEASSRHLLPLQLILPAANVAWAQRKLGKDTPVDYVAMDDRALVCREEFYVHGVAAAHNELSVDYKGRSHYLGYVLRFGGFRIFHPGDTLWHNDLLPALMPFQPFDLMMLPINGNKPERRVAGNMRGLEAAAFARAANARMVVPCHYEMFEFNTEPPDEFISTCEKLRQPFKILKGGERLTLEREDR